MCHSFECILIDAPAKKKTAICFPFVIEIVYIVMSSILLGEKLLTFRSLLML